MKGSRNMRERLRRGSRMNCRWVVAIHIQDYFEEAIHSEKTTLRVIVSSD